MKKLLTLVEAAEFLNLKVSRLRYEVFNKRVPHFKIGRSIRFDTEDLINWVKEQKVKWVMDIIHTYFEKRRRLSNKSTYAMIKRIEILSRFNLLNLSDLLFKLQQNGESTACVEATKSLLINTANLVKALKPIKSRIKRDLTWKWKH
jgi:excisionase family DNA binding protein